ncbi:MAG: MBOAT family protein [Clostridia bacterium]|nr:MBOAT family protein [Clostridia bacterium]
MSYMSLAFFAFVTVTATVYFLFPAKKYQWTVLLAASYTFYLMAGYKHAAFIVLTTVSTYCSALWIDRIAMQAAQERKAHKSDWNREQKKAFKLRTDRAKRRIIILDVALNLGILAFLKYYNFFSESFNRLLALGGTSFSLPALNLFLPLGISFYMFQSIGYVLDVSREKVKAERNFAKVALFVSFFPQIIQGPISFYDQLAAQLYAPHRFDFTRLKHGCKLIIWGLFKKLVIADRAYIAIKTVLAGYGDYSGTTLTFTVLLYALQLYTDFSGGIDLSRGVAQILGIDMAQNFRRPYFATTINDYWRRWHITLGAWMKEYVFYPLALSKSFASLSNRIRKSRIGASKAGAHVAKALPTSLASLIVFFLVGIWHGANWKYVAFGLWNGGVIMLSVLLSPVFAKLASALRINIKSRAFLLFKILRTFLIVFIGYVFDVAADLTASMYTFRMMLLGQDFSRGLAEISTLGLSAADYLILGIGTAVLFTVSVIQERHPSVSLRVMLDRRNVIVRHALLLACIMFVLIFGVYGHGYDPADFIYMQF